MDEDTCAWHTVDFFLSETIPSFGYSKRRGWRRTRPAGSHLRLRTLLRLRAAPLVRARIYISGMTRSSSTLPLPTLPVHPPPTKTRGCLHLNPTLPRTAHRSSWRNTRLCCPRPNNNLPLLNSNNDPSARHPPPPPPLPHSTPLVSLPPASPTIRFHGPTLCPPPPTPPLPLPDPHLGVPPVFPATLHPRYPRAYAAYKAGGLANSNDGSMIPPGKSHSYSFL